MLALVALATATVVQSGRIASETALAEAEGSTTRLADFVVAPLLDDRAAGVPGADAALDQLVATRIVDGSLRDALVWSADGEVLWASDPDLEGRRVAVPTEVTAAVVDGERSSGLEETREAEAGGGDGRDGDSELEIYVPLELADGQRVAFEAYYPSDRVERQASLLRWRIIPTAVGALVALQVVQFLVARRLAYRVAEHQADRALLLARSLDASERERRTIAADVHDGPVQELAGVAYAISALQLTAPPAQRPVLDQLGDVVQEAVGQLRRLMVDIYPPDLSGPGLALAVGDQVTPLRDAGLDVELRTEPLGHVASTTAATVYRVAKETLTNVVKHARAEHVQVELGTTELAGAPAVRLAVCDDGVGLPSDGIERRAEGHLGLRLLIDRVADLGGTLTVATPPDGGTVITVVLPCNSGE